MLSSFLKKLFIFGCAGFFVAACGLSLVIASRGYSLVAMHGLLIAVASLLAEHGLQASLLPTNVRILVKSLNSSGSDRLQNKSIGLDFENFFNSEISFSFSTLESWCNNLKVRVANRLLQLQAKETNSNSFKHKRYLLRI